MKCRKQRSDTRQNLTTLPKTHPKKMLALPGASTHVASEMAQSVNTFPELNILGSYNFSIIAGFRTYYVFLIESDLEFAIGGMKNDGSN